MPFDSWGSNLEGQISKLERWINALHNAPVKEPQRHLANLFTEEIKAELLVYLIRERDSLQRQLDSHRQHDKERGIKY